MIVVLMGGLGNQAFAAAFGMSVSAARGEEVVYAQQGLGAGSIRAYSLGAFKIRDDIKFIHIDQARRQAKDVFHDNGMDFKFQPSVYTAPAGTLFEGCWQTEKYFDAQKVRAAFDLRNTPSFRSLHVASQIVAAGNRSAFLHVRRTDYITNPLNPEFHGGPTMRYYNEAIERVRAHYEDARFFVFSDDPTWCRAVFPAEFTIVDHNKMGMNGQTGQEHEDIWLMRLCQNAAVANSSFSWWGAWLGDDRPNRLVFAPERWFKTPTMEDCDIVPERWVKLAN